MMLQKHLKKELNQIILLIFKKDLVIKKIIRIFVKQKMKKMIKR